MGTRRNSLVTRVVSLCDLATGRLIGGRDGLIEVSGNGGYSLPVTKPDGHFVFVDEPLRLLSVRSAVFEDFELAVEGTDAAVLRFGLIRKKNQKSHAWDSTGPCHELTLGAGEAAWVGFGGPGLGYGLAADVRAGDEEIVLDKDDFNDLTWLRLAAVGADASVEVLALKGSTAMSRYVLSAPAARALAARETEAFALVLVVGAALGTVVLPVPTGAQHLYVARGVAALGTVETIKMAALATAPATVSTATPTSTAAVQGGGAP
jgi:hypothetical protein